MRMRAPVFAAGILLGSIPASAEPATTRIEPRPFYGATITIEAGVRVFRPLPPHDRIIIAPDSAGPVYLGVGAGNRRSYIDGYRR
jgi:hypothetical protein